MHYLHRFWVPLSQLVGVQKHDVIGGGKKTKMKMRERMKKRKEVEEDIRKMMLTDLAGTAFA